MMTNTPKMPKTFNVKPKGYHTTFLRGPIEALIKIRVPSENIGINKKEPKINKRKNNEEYKMIKFISIFLDQSAFHISFHTHPRRASKSDTFSLSWALVEPAPS